MKKVHGPSLVSTHFTLPSNLVRKLQSMSHEIHSILLLLGSREYVQE